ncbi:acyltransferase [Acidocella sp.]|uniref:acyltransferase family protein n=1 Tax=Acidocella sp. TaxID=50710 RepID=UPI00260E01C9|nr:acyltransferase [Acidocella sp.]
MSPARTPPSPAVNGHERHIKSLDGLRGVSALLVLFHHVLLTQPDFGRFEWNSAHTRAHGLFEWLMFDTPFRILWAGQDRAILFFVLSGFVLSLPWLHGRPRTYGRFLLNRFCRLYPPYLIVMLIAAIGVILIGGRHIPGASVWFNQLGWSRPLSWRAVPSAVFLLNNGSSNWLDESVWSLIWEARVVVIFPFLIWVITRWKNPGIAVILLGLASLHPLIMLLLPHHIAAALRDTGTAMLYPEYFILGVAVALNQNTVRSWLSRGWGIAGLGTLTLGLTMFWIQWPEQNGRADGIAAMLILASALGSPVLDHALRAKFLLFLGRLSYSLYLIHVPIILAIIILFHGKVPLLACLAAPMLCIGVAELFRRHVEAPSASLALGFAKPAAPAGAALYPATREVVPE